MLQRWFAPSELHVTRVEVDERVGGHHRTWQAGPDAEVGGFDCELLELVPGARIVLRWRFVGLDRVHDPALDSRLTVTLSPAPGGATALALVHEGLDAVEAAMPGMAAAAAEGWAQALDALAAAIGPRALRLP